MKVKAKCARALIRYIKAKENERENSNEFVQPNCIMQLADSVSVAKIKIIYASRQRAHSEPGVHSYNAAVHLTGDQ